MATKPEFLKWLADFGSFFPDLASYTSRLPEMEKTIDGWYRTLAPFSQVVLGMVTNAMLDNKIAPLEANEYGLFAIRIRAYAARISDDINRRRKSGASTGDDEQKFSGVAASLTTSAALLAHSKAAVRVCMRRGFNEYWIDKVNLAAVFLADTPNEQDREQALHTLMECELTEDDLRPQMEDYRNDLIPAVDDACDLADVV